jgi:hypothetical protein
MKTATRQAVTHIQESQRFESMYTLQGKTRPTRHMHPTLSPHILRGQRIATFHEPPTDLDGSHCSREKGLPTQSTARRLTNEAVGLSQASVDDKLLDLLGPYH